VVEKVKKKILTPKTHPPLDIVVVVLMMSVQGQSVCGLSFSSAVL
jgi:hypothetical protein